MTDTQERRVVFGGAVNFRDLGGYPAAGGRKTRWRRLFRADSLGDLTPADITQLDGLGLNGLIDFRTEIERLLKPNRLPPGARLRKLEIGFLPEGTVRMIDAARKGAITTDEIAREVTGHYRRFVTDHTGEYRQAVAFAADPTNYPLLIHCTSGKDRTGFAAAVLLSAVGVPRDHVLQDYDLTNQYRRDVSHLFGRTTSKEVVDLLLSAQSRYIEAALDEIDRVYGSIDGYLAKGLGVDEAARERLVDLLTEDA